MRNILFSSRYSSLGKSYFLRIYEKTGKNIFLEKSEKHRAVSRTSYEVLAFLWLYDASFNILSQSKIIAVKVFFYARLSMKKIKKLALKTHMHVCIYIYLNFHEKKNKFVCNFACKMTNKHREKYNFRVVFDI